MNSAFRQLAWVLAFAVTGWGMARAAVACGGPDPVDRAGALEQAFSDVPRDSEGGVSTLRREGQAGLDWLMNLRRGWVAAHQKAVEEAGMDPDTERLPKEIESGQARLAMLDAVIDRVGGQRNCSSSGLYWYTDMNEARAAAWAAQKPILSLRMMGLLTDEMSCANSRFFRSTLYANQEIAKYLSSHYILHWQSVRPVPKVTIDFGDGRKLERTLTGNSAHYILAVTGEPIDCLPGLFGPAKFLEELQRGEAAAQEFGKQPANERLSFLKALHAERIGELTEAWEADLVAAKTAIAKADASNAATAKFAAARGQVRQGAQDLVAQQQGAQQQGAPPSTQVAEQGAPARVAVTGSSPYSSDNPFSQHVARLNALDAEMTDKLWEAIAVLHRADGKLDAAAIAVIRSQNPLAANAGRLAMTKARVEDPLLRLVASLQSSISLDSVRNEYRLHRTIHEWFVSGQNTYDVNVLNDRVYEHLFLTPNHDPWIGLVRPDAYTALPNNGVVVAKP